MTKNGCKHCQPHVGTLDFAPLVSSVCQAIDWAFDAGARFANEYPDEIAVIERVRVFVHGAVTGTGAQRPCFDDLVFAGALIIGALEQHAGDQGAFARVLDTIEPRSPPPDLRPYVLQIYCAYVRMLDHHKSAA